jgi:type IV fimbrial biogenesis protein FimT
MKKLYRQSGFSLMEMVIVMALIAIVAALALPNSGGWIDNNRLSSAASDLVVAMQTGRAEAVGRNAPVTLCKKNAAGTACIQTGGWDQGWLLFVDTDSDATLDSGEEVLQVHDAIKGNLSFHGTSQVKDFITFRASGRTSVTSTQTLILCDTRGFGIHAKGLVVSILGRASVMAAPDTGQTACLGN